MQYRNRLKTVLADYTSSDRIGKIYYALERQLVERPKFIRGIDYANQIIWIGLPFAMAIAAGTGLDNFAKETIMKTKHTDIEAQLYKAAGELGINQIMGGALGFFSGTCLSIVGFFHFDEKIQKLKETAKKNLVS